MYISDMLKDGRPNVSFELFPPKQMENMEKTRSVVKEMSTLSPSFMSITYGALGTTALYTAELSEEVQACGVEALAHLTCVAATKESVAKGLARLKAAGIRNILALRGDFPPDYVAPAYRDYVYASDLVAEIKRAGGFCVGGACYPEGHVESANREQDIDNLRYKIDAGCEYLITQMFFDNNALYRFLYRMLAKNIRVPVIAGIMPITNRAQIERTIKLSGTVLPPRFLAMLDRFGDDPAAMRQAGIAYATDQIIDLIANGVNDIHLYTMNRPDVTRAIMHNLSDIIGA